MDNWQAMQSWALLGVAVAGLTYYYAPRSDPTASHKAREQPTSAETPKKRRESKPKPVKQTSPKPAAPVAQPAPKPVVVETPVQSGSEGAKKRKGKKQAGKPQKAAPAVAAKQPEPESEEDEIDMSTRQFAEQMARARQGHQIGGTANNKEQRIRTVKQGSAMTQADDSFTSNQAGDVSDMLEPTAPGPSSLRIVASEQPKKEKKAKQQKEEVVETKKQRQNRQKVEERRIQREEEEEQRKALAEKQRRVAREARGEPSKNGIPVSKAPANNQWTEKSSTPAPAVNGTSHSQLLDTFDAESTGSSNGGLGASTAATSTTDGKWEQEQLAQAMKESEDEAGWTTVAQPKKQQKKASTSEATGESTPVAAAPKPKQAAPAVKPVSGIKPNGFQALQDSFSQRTDADPNDPSNWDP